MNSDYTIKESGKFQYIDEGEGDLIVLLHGLFGALSNWGGVIRHFRAHYRVIIPLLPIYEMPKKEASVEGLSLFVDEFIQDRGLSQFHVCGNSLGGHVALKYTLENSKNVKSIILTGSSGLFESGMGNSFPKRGSYDYVHERVGYTFYDPSVASKAFVDEIYSVVNDTNKCLRIIYMARSAQRQNMANEIKQIDQPVCLIWGLNDTITPPKVAHDFHRLLKNSQLNFIDKCCHAPMMERPEAFNRILERFLNGFKSSKNH